MSVVHGIEDIPFEVKVIQEFSICLFFVIFTLNLYHLTRRGNAGKTSAVLQADENESKTINYVHLSAKKGEGASTANTINKKGDETDLSVLFADSLFHF